jgi:hypothetical protein
MAIERVYWCDNPSCADQFPDDQDTPAHAKTASPPPHLPAGMLEVREGGPNGGSVHHFCGWECVMKFAATLPPPEIIPLSDKPDGG